MRTRIGQGLRSARWVLAALAVVGALGGLFLDVHLDRLPVRSSAQLVFSSTADSADSASTQDSYITNKMPTYAQLATSGDVLGPAAAAVGTTVRALRPEVTAGEVEDTTVLSVEVRAATPRAAAAGAAAVITSLRAKVTQLETPPDQPSRVKVTTASPPSVPEARFVPPRGTLTAVGALAGALVVVLAVVAWASGLPQRGWRRFSGWLFRAPEDDPALLP